MKKKKFTKGIFKNMFPLTLEDHPVKGESAYYEWVCTYCGAVVMRSKIPIRPFAFISTDVVDPTENFGGEFKDDADIYCKCGNQQIAYRKINKEH